MRWLSSATPIWFRHDQRGFVPGPVTRAVRMSIEMSSSKGVVIPSKLGVFGIGCICIHIYDPGPRSRSPPPPPPQWYGPPLAAPQTSRLHAVCRLSPQLRAICCVWVMSSLVCGLFASIWDLRFLICRLLEASMHFCLYYVLIPRHVYCHHHSCLASVLLMCCWHLI